MRHPVYQADASLFLSRPEPARIDSVAPSSPNDLFHPARRPCNIYRGPRSQLGISVSYRTLRTMAKPLTMASLAMASGCFYPSDTLCSSPSPYITLYALFLSLARTLSLSLCIEAPTLAPFPSVSFRVYTSTVSCFHRLDLSSPLPTSFYFLERAPSIRLSPSPFPFADSRFSDSPSLSPVPSAPAASSSSPRGSVKCKRPGPKPTTRSLAPALSEHLPPSANLPTGTTAAGDIVMIFPQAVCRVKHCPSNGLRFGLTLFLGASRKRDFREIWKHRGYIEAD